MCHGEKVEKAENVMQKGINDFGGCCSQKCIKNVEKWLEYNFFVLWEEECL